MTEESDSEASRGETSKGKQSKRHYGRPRTDHPAGAHDRKQNAEGDPPPPAHPGGLLDRIAEHKPSSGTQRLLENVVGGLVVNIICWGFVYVPESHWEVIAGFAAGVLIAVVVLLGGTEEYATLRGRRQFVFTIVATALILALWVWVSGNVIPMPTKEWDFEEISNVDWGEHPQDEVHKMGLGVQVHRGEQSPVRKKGNSSLQFTPTKIINQNAYVTVMLNDTRVFRVTAWVYVPEGANIDAGNTKSTAKIIVWDEDGQSRESSYKKLNPGEWRSISWDLRRARRTGPCCEFGIHFYFATAYKGPVYIDDVAISVPAEDQ